MRELRTLKKLSSNSWLLGLARKRAARLKPNGGNARAYPFSDLSERRVVNDEIAGRHIVVLWTPGTASALDAAIIVTGREVGATGVFDRVLDGERLDLKPDGDQFSDTQTGSKWNVLGYATAGPLAGQRLQPINHGNHFWFAWAVFKPETKVIR